MTKRVQILHNFSVSGRDFVAGEIYKFHGTRYPNMIVVTNDKNEFAVSIPQGLCKIINKREEVT